MPGSVHEKIVLFGRRPVPCRNPSERKPLSVRVDICDGLWVGPVDEGTRRGVIEACAPPSDWRKKYCCPEYLYGFVSEISDYDLLSGWDESPALSVAICLSRLAHPTSVSTELSAWHDVAKQAFYRGPTSGLSSRAFVIRPDEDFLAEEDARLLGQLMSSVRSSHASSRVGRALWLHEHACCIHEANLRWGIVASGIESLVKREEYKATKQFVEGLLHLASAVSVDVSESDCRAIYDRRSLIAHGIELWKMNGEVERLYAKMEDILRLSLKKAILEISFADYLNSDDKMQAFTPE